MTPFEVGLILAGSFLGGFVNAIAGGGGLVSLPVMLGVFPQAPLPSIFGTTKSAMVWGTAWAARSYAAHVNVSWMRLVPALIMAVLGGFIGAWALTYFESEWLRKVLPVLLAFVFWYTLASQHFGRDHVPTYHPPCEAAFAGVIAFCLGIYDGFFGPGTGSFFVFFFVRFLGYDFLHASASAKALNAATNTAAICVFASSGVVWWSLVIPMAIVNIVGAGLGTTVAFRRGSGFVRNIFLLVIAVLILKTAIDAYWL